MFDARGRSITSIINHICVDRGINNLSEFVNPGDEWILSPYDLKNMNRAVECFDNHIQNKSAIGVLFDTDADGLTAGTEMTNYLSDMGITAKTFINSGKKHGLYLGDQMDNIIQSGIELLIIVDSLDKSTEGYEILNNNGVDIIILDHHDIELNYDKYAILVSSQMQYGNNALSGAGVTLKFLMALDEKYGTEYADKYFDLAAIGILADVSDVYESMENRAIINRGLNNLQNPAVKKILGSYEFNSKSVLFSIAPMVNACVRTNETELAKAYFLETNNKELLSYKKTIESCREEQNEEKERLLDSCREQMNNQSGKCKFAYIDTEYGVSGLLGNTLVEEYQMPVFIFNLSDGDTVIGSMRCIGYENFKTKCNYLGLAELVGHESAAGCIIPKDNIEKFIVEVNNLLKNEEYIPESNTEEADFLINYTDITKELVENIGKINRISGKGFKPITFKVEGITDYTVSKFKDGKHLVLYVDNTNLMVIDWNTSFEYDGETFPEWEDHAIMNDELSVVGELESGFMGRQFRLKLIAKELEV